MHTADLDVVKDIPGYKVILKAVLRSQIQQLVEQLATHTDEESVILSANVTDGTLCHLGSESGKCFLEDHDAVKSQFLGFCLKRYHNKKSEANKEATQNVLASLSRSSTQLPYSAVSSQSFSPKAQSFSPKVPNSRSRGPHPVSLLKAPVGLRHDPYARNRPGRKPFDKGPQASKPAATPEQTATNEVIKIEPISDSRDSDSGAQAFDTSKTSQGSSPVPAPAQTPDLDNTKSEVSDDDNSDMPFASDDIADTSYDNQSDVPGSTSVAGQDGARVPGTGGDLDASDGNVFDAHLGVKSESMMESEYDLEATGMEPGGAGAQDAAWGPEGLGFDPTGATGNPSDMPGDQSYKSKNRKEYKCDWCGKTYRLKSRLTFHVKNIHLESTDRTVCLICNFRCSSMANLKLHQRNVHLGQKREPCDECEKRFATKMDLMEHRRQYHGDKKLKCDKCGAEFAYARNLTRHKLGCGQKVAKRFACDKCDRIYQDKRTLTSHIQMKHMGNQFICQMCGKSFEIKFSLTRHMDTVHKE